MLTPKNQSVSLTTKHGKNQIHEDESKLNKYEDEEREDLEIRGCRGYNRNDRVGNYRLEMGRQKRVDKENKFTLGTKRCKKSRFCT